MTWSPSKSTLFPYTTLFRSSGRVRLPRHVYWSGEDPQGKEWDLDDPRQRELVYRMVMIVEIPLLALRVLRSEEHTSELQSPYDLVCRLLLEEKNMQELPRVF